MSTTCLSVSASFPPTRVFASSYPPVPCTFLLSLVSIFPHHARIFLHLYIHLPPSWLIPCLANFLTFPPRAHVYLHFPHTLSSSTHLHADLTCTRCHPLSPPTCRWFLQPPFGLFLVCDELYPPFGCDNQHPQQRFLLRLGMVSISIIFSPVASFTPIVYSRLYMSILCGRSLDFFVLFNISTLLTPHSASRSTSFASFYL